MEMCKLFKLKFHASAQVLDLKFSIWIPNFKFSFLNIKKEYLIARKAGNKICLLYLFTH